MDNSEITQEFGWDIHKGQVRDSNEDSLGAVKVNQAGNDKTESVGLYVVADGMGGHQAGEVASQLAVHTVIREFMAELSYDMPENYQKWLKSAVAIANQMILNRGQEDHVEMGTTLVMAVVVGSNVHIVNVGDSRAYLISESGIRQLTKDHTFVQKLVEVGAITPEQAIDHPHRNILTQAVGTTEDITIDLFNEKLQENDYLLLCSDGLWDELSNQEIWQIVMSADSAQAACQALVDATNAAGGRDNIAIVLVKLKQRGN
jgi:protein phosphatase